MIISTYDFVDCLVCVDQFKYIDRVGPFHCAEHVRISTYTNIGSVVRLHTYHHAMVWSIYTTSSVLNPPSLRGASSSQVDCTDCIKCVTVSNVSIVCVDCVC